MCIVSICFGLQVVPIKVLWGQGIYCLGSWARRVILSLQNPFLESDSRLQGSEAGGECQRGGRVVGRVSVGGVEIPENPM